MIISTITTTHHMRLIAALMLISGSAFAQPPQPVSDAFKGGMILDALEFRKYVLHDSSKIDVCRISRIVGHAEATVKMITTRIGSARFIGSSGPNCVPLTLAGSPNGKFTGLVVEGFEFTPGISDSVATSYNLDRNPANRAGLASITLFVLEGNYNHGFSETYTFAIMQDGAGGRHVFKFFLDAKFHHFQR
jgi:hypothetical protein